MFQLYITLGYFIPNIYIFFRIRHLFIGKGYKAWYSLVYLIVAAISPLARFSRNDMAGLRDLLNIASGYLVPFFLYLFLALLLYDLFLLLNLAIKRVSVETRKKFSYKAYALSTMIVFSVLIVIGGSINLNTIRTTEYRVEIPRRDSKLNHLRIAFVADFHIDRNTKLGFVKQYVNKIKALKPDILLYGGDIVEGRADKIVHPLITEALRSIKTRYGLYGILGNHEFYGSDNPGRLYSMINTRLLRDEVIKIDGSFYLAGRIDQHADERKPLKEILAKATSNLPVILVYHRPTQMQETSLTKTDVQFSGHAHNGQMFPLNLLLASMYDLSWGYRTVKDTHFFVTCGLRLWGPPVKTAGISEIMVVNITFR